MKMTSVDRTLLLLTGLLAAYQVAVGINGLGAVSITAYTIGFGILLVAGLLMLILGFDVLDAPLVVIVSTIIPLSLSTGLVWELLVPFRTSYLVFAMVGFLSVVVTRSFPTKSKSQTIVLALVHGVAGLTIFLLPSILAADGTRHPAFALVGLGGALISLVGLLLSFLKTGRPIVPRETVLKIFPSLLLLMTACFVAGFKFG